MKQPDISPELQNEYNSKYQKAFDILSQHVFTQGASRLPGPFAKKDIKKAISLLHRCLEIWRESWAAMWGVGKAHQALGNHRTALGWFERALRIEQDNPDVYREATIESLSTGEAEKALNYATKARELKPEDAGLQSNRALALLLNKRGEEALTAIQEVRTKKPDDQVSKNVFALISDVVSGKKPYPTKV
jgi:tetratricopeptide (TPR) repeat protein